MNRSYLSHRKLGLIQEQSMRKALSIFSLFCGTGMFVVWGLLLTTGNVPELKSTPFEAGSLLAAELMTAVSLILAGFGLLARIPWADRMSIVALGMLLYCTVYSVGVFAQTGNLPAAIFFGTIAALAVVLSARSVFWFKKGAMK